MKAAVLHEAGGIPRYEDFPDPVAGEGEVIIGVKAVACGARLLDLAARLGVQQPTLYWHFPNKAALVTAIADRCLGGRT